ncbi:uncharacterized protein LOC135846867 [Planococcus citri]|uniref:uncharacterized protein LOC135846867 n=1 Tax=Planococcus citri TaxID=170843 RepID=UPI0031F886D7
MMKAFVLFITTLLLIQFVRIEANFNIPNIVKGKPVNEKLYNFMIKLSEASEAIRLALNWNVSNELSVLHEFADDRKAYTTAMREIAQGAQKILNSTLEEIEFKKKVGIKRFVDAILEYQKTKRIQNPKMDELAKKIYEFRKAQFLNKHKNIPH